MENTNPIPGTEVKLSPGLLPEEPTGDITINTGTGGSLDFDIDPAGYVNYHDHGEILAKLDELSAKVDHLLEHAHQGYEVTLKKNESP
tara:strand:- start:202 stop:465 length:264 start_codon:yes stop_codon:yes gene_type:complete